MAWGSFSAIAVKLMRRPRKGRIAQLVWLVSLALGALILLGFLVIYRQFITAEEFSIVIVILGLASLRFRQPALSCSMELASLIAIGVSQLLVMILSFRLISLEWRWQAIAASFAIVGMVSAYDALRSTNGVEPALCKHLVRIATLLILSSPFAVLTLYYFNALPRSYALVVIIYFFAGQLLRELRSAMNNCDQLPALQRQTGALVMLFMVLLLALRLGTGTGL